MQCGCLWLNLTTYVSEARGRDARPRATASVRCGTAELHAAHAPSQGVGDEGDVAASAGLRSESYLPPPVDDVVLALVAIAIERLVGRLAGVDVLGGPSVREPPRGLRLGHQVLAGRLVRRLGRRSNQSHARTLYRGSSSPAPSTVSASAPSRRPTTLGMSPAYDGCEP
jgi:hypothetical protein